MADEMKPVIVSLNVEGFGGHATEDYEIDRVEWDAMTIVERNDLLNDLAETHATNHIGYGWHIYEPTDMAETISS